ncbi:hypothetical protein EVAR_425_1 [Eumeta japonica]|uniref:Uncharacterized protein n=1 Tax=Eumeta variegata TaxID=151549 RepID=A0A4C1SAD1_EUMVA|nr:hypothetical protein EVAR_425_1 [Eumeta japonica]
MNVPLNMAVKNFTASVSRREMAFLWDFLHYEFRAFRRGRGQSGLQGSLAKATFASLRTLSTLGVGANAKRHPEMAACDLLSTISDATARRDKCYCRGPIPTLRDLITPLDCATDRPKLARSKLLVAKCQG